ncbi:MAG: hypothetical protein ACR2LG_10195 [Actinomycetota bacterium]
MVIARGRSSLPDYRSVIVVLSSRMMNISDVAHSLVNAVASE